MKITAKQLKQIIMEEMDDRHRKGTYDDLNWWEKLTGSGNKRVEKPFHDAKAELKAHAEKVIEVATGHLGDHNAIPHQESLKDLEAWKLTDKLREIVSKFKWAEMLAPDLDELAEKVLLADLHTDFEETWNDGTNDKAESIARIGDQALEKAFEQFKEADLKKPNPWIFKENKMKITAKRLKQIIMQEIKGLNEEGGLSQALAAPVLTGQDARDFSKEQEDFDTNINYLEGRNWIQPDEKDPTFQAAVQAVLDSGTPKSKETEEYAALSGIVRKTNEREIGAAESAVDSFKEVEDEIEEAKRVVRNLNNIARETVANAVGYAAKRAGRKDHAALHQALNSK